MSDTIYNSGLAVTRGTVNAGQIAAGPGASITNAYPRPARPAAAARPSGIALITIKAVEMRAVIEVFGLGKDKETVGGQIFYSGTVESADSTADIVAARTLEKGQRSMMATLTNVRQHKNPAVIVVVGVGGGISAELSIGDVVFANRVIYYDLRRETAAGVRHRGEERHAPTGMTHALNAFFTDHGEPARLESAGGSLRVLSGPIGSGDAVITDAESHIRRFLLTYNENTLAVDMEAGGLTQFCHETAPPQPAWLVVRGVSDVADHAMTQDHQPMAARNAALALQRLIPYLPTKV